MRGLSITFLLAFAVQRQQMILLSLLAALLVLSLSATAAARGCQWCLLRLLSVASTVLLLSGFPHFPLSPFVHPVRLKFDHMTTPLRGRCSCS